VTPDRAANRPAARNQHRRGAGCRARGAVTTAAAPRTAAGHPAPQRAARDRAARRRPAPALGWPRRRSSGCCAARSRTAPSNSRITSVDPAGTWTSRRSPVAKAATLLADDGARLPGCRGARDGRPLRASEIGRAIAVPEARARFEAPFAWTGTACPCTARWTAQTETRDGWRVVDFKTDPGCAPGRDRRGGGRRPYRCRWASMRAPRRAATGEAARAGLLFLRHRRVVGGGPRCSRRRTRRDTAPHRRGLLTDDSGDAGDIQDDA